jgi:tripartite-type tricarboxylate transporter receptor subunit TctC
MEAFKHAFGLNMIHVPYKGTGQSVPALLGGQVSLLFSAGPSIMQHWKAGKLKVLAVNSAKRSPQAPDVPTIAESGVPGFDYPAEIGVLAPAGTPAPIVARLSAEFAKAVKQPDVAVGSTAEAYAAHNREAYKKYEAVVKQSGARVE